jgi:hypothetical protein
MLGGLDLVHDQQSWFARSSLCLADCGELLCHVKTFVQVQDLILLMHFFPFFVIYIMKFYYWSSYNAVGESSLWLSQLSG